MVHPVGQDESRPAELHSSFHNASAVITDNPFQGVWRVRLGGCRRRILECDLIKPESDLRIGGC